MESSLRPAVDQLENRQRRFAARLLAQASSIYWIASVKAMRTGCTHGDPVVPSS